MGPLGIYIFNNILNFYKKYRKERGTLKRQGGHGPAIAACAMCTYRPSSLLMILLSCHYVPSSTTTFLEHDLFYRILPLYPCPLTMYHHQHKILI